MLWQFNEHLYGSLIARAAPVRTECCLLNVSSQRWMRIVKVQGAAALQAVCYRVSFIVYGEEKVTKECPWITWWVGWPPSSSTPIPLTFLLDAGRSDRWLQDMYQSCTIRGQPCMTSSPVNFHGFFLKITAGRCGSSSWKWSFPGSKVADN